MITRIRDLRVSQAQDHGIIVGLPPAFAQDVAMIADLLTNCLIWSDLTLMFPALVQHDATTWKVAVSGGWSIIFNWLAPWGPVELRLDKG